MKEHSKCYKASGLIEPFIQKASLIAAPRHGSCYAITRRREASYLIRASMFGDMVKGTPLFE
jgi:hypothetical protein